jgi:hypothetical protein
MERKDVQVPLWLWVDDLAEPDRRFLRLAVVSDEVISARELAEAVAKRTAAGEAFLRIIEDNVRRSSLVEVLAKFTAMPDAAGC